MMGANDIGVTVMRTAIAGAGRDPDLFCRENQQAVWKSTQSTVALENARDRIVSALAKVGWHDFGTSVMMDELGLLREDRKGLASFGDFTVSMLTSVFPFKGVYVIGFGFGLSYKGRNVMEWTKKSVDALFPGRY